MYKKLFSSDFRWKVYNIAFTMLGNTKLWPELGFILWS